MRKPLVAAMVCTILSCAVLVGGFSSARAEECTTQGAYALALAQVLKFDVTTVEAAISALVGIGVEPDGGWKPDACLDEAVRAQVSAALGRAVAVFPGLGKGADAAAFEALRDPDRLYPEVSPAK